MKLDFIQEPDFTPEEKIAQLVDLCSRLKNKLIMQERKYEEDISLLEQKYKKAIKDYEWEHRNDYNEKKHKCGQQVYKAQAEARELRKRNEKLMSILNKLIDSGELEAALKDKEE